jgi:hypothetical protein
MSLYDVFAGIEATGLGTAIKESSWLFPVIEAFHLLALATLGGAVIVVDLRLMGTGLTKASPSVVERAARPWLVGAIVVLVVSGVVIGVSEAIKLYGKPSFWVKMTALVAALVFTFAVRGPLAAKDPKVGVATWLVGLVSMSLWLTVGLAGRWIGFS